MKHSKVALVLCVLVALQDRKFVRCMAQNSLILNPFDEDTSVPTRVFDFLGGYVNHTIITDPDDPEEQVSPMDV